MTPDPQDAAECRRRADGSINTEPYLDRARDERNAVLAAGLRACLAPFVRRQRPQTSGARNAATRSSAASASGSRP